MIGRGLDVWELIATVRDNDGSIWEHPDEIDREIELNEAEYKRGRAAATGGQRALRA